MTDSFDTGKFFTTNDGVNLPRNTQYPIIVLEAPTTAAITIFIITYVDLVNKRRQIGIQRAIGITSSAIFLSYLMRAVIYSVVGVILGTLVYTYVVVPIEHANPLRLPAGYVYLTSDTTYTLFIIGVLIIVSLVSATIPTLKTLRIKILDAIWG